MTAAARWLIFIESNLGNSDHVCGTLLPHPPAPRVGEVYSSVLPPPVRGRRGLFIRPRVQQEGLISLSFQGKNRPTAEERGSLARRPPGRRHSAGPGGCEGSRSWRTGPGIARGLRQLLPQRQHWLVQPEKPKTCWLPFHFPFDELVFVWLRVEVECFLKWRKGSLVHFKPTPKRVPSKKKTQPPLAYVRNFAREKAFPAFSWKTSPSSLW